MKTSGFYGVLQKKTLLGIVRGDIFQEPFDWNKVLEKGLTVFLVDLEKAKKLREIQNLKLKERRG